jgi:hypothetical protein
MGRREVGGFSDKYANTGYIDVATLLDNYYRYRAATKANLQHTGISWKFCLTLPLAL